MVAINCLMVPISFRMHIRCRKCACWPPLTVWFQYRFNTKITEENSKSIEKNPRLAFDFIYIFRSLLELTSFIHSVYASWIWCVHHSRGSIFETEIKLKETDPPLPQPSQQLGNICVKRMLTGSEQTVSKVCSSEQRIKNQWDNTQKPYYTQFSHHFSF